MSTGSEKLSLLRKGDQVFARLGDRSEEIPVKLVWVRPISGRGREISVVGKDKKEIMLLSDSGCLDPDSRAIAEEELERRYLVPKITKVTRTESTFGNRYWDVETDRGLRRFLVTDPNVNVLWLTDDRLVIRDTFGNRYEIDSFSALDKRSKTEIEKVI